MNCCQVKVTVKIYLLLLGLIIQKVKVTVTERSLTVELGACAISMRVPVRAVSAKRHLRAHAFFFACARSMREGDALWHALGQGLWFRWHLSLIVIKGCFLCACVCGMSVFMGLTRLLFLCVLCFVPWYLVLVLSLLEFCVCLCRGGRSGTSV